MESLKKRHEEEIEFHEKEIKRHKDAIKRHKEKRSDLEKHKKWDY